MDMSGISRGLPARRSRRLPRSLLTNQAASLRLRASWPSYRSALVWLRRQQGMMDAALGLLKLYPALIQDACLDSLWNFIRPLVARELIKERNSVLHPITTAKNVYHHAHIGQKRLQASKGGSKKNDDLVVADELASHIQVPSIAVSREHSEPRDYSEIPPALLHQPSSKYLFLCTIDSSIERSVLVPLMFHTTKFCCIRRSNISLDTAFNERVVDPVLDSDCVLFFLTHTNIRNKACIRQLQAATDQELPVIFVRQPGFRLPDPLPVNLFDLATKLNVTEESFSHLSSMVEVPDARSKSVSPLPHGRKGAAKLELRTELLSARSRGVTQKCGKFGSPTRGIDKASECMASVIIRGFKNAVLFSNEFISSSMDQLYTKIASCIGDEFVECATPSSTTRIPATIAVASPKTASSHSPSGLLSVPAKDGDTDKLDTSSSSDKKDFGDRPHNSSNKKEVFNVGLTSATQSARSSFSDTETFYAVFPNKGGDNEVRVIKWPPDRRRASRESHTFESPTFGFEDVNLNTSIIDLLEEKSDSET